MKLKRAGCVGCLFLLAAPAALLMWVVSPPGAPNRPRSPEEQKAAQAALEAKRVEVDKLMERVREGKEGDFVLRISQEEINSFLEVDGSGKKIKQKADVDDAYVTIKDGHVEATAVRRTAGIPVTMTAVVTPFLNADGNLDFKIERANLGRLPMPDNEKLRKLTDKATSVLKRRELIPDIKYRKLILEDGAIILTGDTKK